jgi:hypothetical protein
LRGLSVPSQVRRGVVFEPVGHYSSPTGRSMNGG